MIPDNYVEVSFFVRRDRAKLRPKFRIFSPSSITLIQL